MRSLHHRARRHASEPSDASEKDLQELCIMSARRGVEVADGIAGKVCKEADRSGLPYHFQLRWVWTLAWQT